MDKLTYSISEAAEVLGISRSLAYELAKENKIPVLRLGSRIVVPVGRLMKFLEKGEM